jgi:hypothetical protein
MLEKIAMEEEQVSLCEIEKSAYKAKCQAKRCGSAEETRSVFEGLYTDSLKFHDRYKWLK